MSEDSAVVRETLERTRATWRRLALTTALGKWASAAALVVFLALTAYWLVLPTDAWLLTLAALAAASSIALAVPAVRSSWSSPADRQVARFIEERCPELEDRLATAVECLVTNTTLMGRPTTDRTDVGRGFSLVYSDHVVADAAKRLRDFDPDRVVEPAAFRRALALATASVAGLALVLFVGRAPAARAIDLASLYAFPGQVRIEVSPGDVRHPTGRPFNVIARVRGARQVTPNLVVMSGDARRTMPMHTGPELFTITLDGVSADFKYSVEAGGARSGEYSVTVVHAPVVKRIDLHYTYPKAFGLEPRREENGGDIYGPAGTKVQIDVHADKPLEDAALVLANGTRVPLASKSDSSVRTEIELTEDTSYRIALSDRDGLTNPGDTEYFVRLLSDRPPDVRIVQPAGDTQVTTLEEVTIDARADDDHGIDRFELVYAVRGGKESVVPFRVDRSQATVEGRRMLAMEELKVKPGDFVSYYARARDVSRGKRSTEARSDIFFLEVKGFEEEFALAQSGAMGGGGATPFDDLAAAQKEIIIATWKLDRRALDGQSGQSSDDIKAVAAAQGQLRQKTEQSAAQTAGAAIRRRSRPGQDAPAENPLLLAVAAMGRAESALGRTDTKNALPHEMEALNQLLKAQAEVRRSEISRQQASGGGGGYSRRGQDLSALFDRELQRQQQTNYENPNSVEQKNDSQKDEALDKIRDLARRQDELAKRQQELAQKKQQLSEEEFKRQLERLTREQSELRRQAEETSQQMARQSRSDQSGGRSQSDAKGGRSGQQSGSGQTDRMREISEEMRNAANDLRNQELDRASARSGRAGQMLRDLEQQMGGERQPDERMRQLGDMQLEARQLADAQRRVASEASRMTKGTSADEMRRLAGEKDRIADRTQALAEAARRAEVKGADTDALTRQMRESAERMRAQPQMTDADARTEQRMLQEYERLADRLASAGGRGDTETSRAADNMAKAQELRDRFERLSREQDELRDQASQAGARGRGERGSGESRGGRDGRAGGEGGQAAGARGSAGDETAQLKEQLQQKQQEARQILNELKELNPGTTGGTPDGQQMVTSAPGTEAFKQDFAEWDQLKKAIGAALEKAEQNFAQTLREKLAKDRLNAGVGDHTPEPYRKLVEKYYKSLAERKK